MPVSYKIEDLILRFTIEGAHPPDELLDTLRRAAEDPERPEVFGVLLDARRSENNRSTGELRQMAADLGEIRTYSSARLAVLVSSDLHFGLTRVVASIAEAHDLEIRAFRAEASARRWLAGDLLPEESLP